MKVKKWYGARTLYKLSGYTSNSSSKSLYEERIIVLMASSFDDAIMEAEKEANIYANTTSGVIYLEYVSVFELYESKIKNKVEVFSLMRESALTPEKYISNFFDTGDERTKRN